MTHIVAPQWRKKPVVVSALKWRGDNIREIECWTGGVAQYVRTGYETPRLEIGTLEGIMTAAIGDFIIQGVDGEFYPCKPAIFEATYERVT